MANLDHEAGKHPPSATSSIGNRSAAPGRFGCAIEALRLRQWIKNGLVFVPVVFAARLSDWDAWFRAGIGALAFCLAASAVYLVNDIVDRRQDQHHPTKRHRPIASGRLSVPFGLTEAGIVFVVAIFLSIWTGRAFCLAIAAYLVLQIAYNLGFKNRMLLDAICIACGFLLRPVGGALAIGVVISPWLVICTFSLCLFLAFCKRHCEVMTFEDDDTARRHRPTLDRYTPGLLNHLITLSGTLAIVSFLMYSTSARTVHEFGTELFAYTIPLVVYGVCRIAMVSMRGDFDGPETMFLRDRPVQIAGAAWLSCVVVIVLYGRHIEQWFFDSLNRGR